MPLTYRCLMILAGFAVLSHAATTFAQDELPPSQGAEPFAVGVTGTFGLPGRMAGVRVSLPVGRKVGADITLGRVHGFGEEGQVAGGTTFAAQARWHWHGRDAQGRSGYWFYGVVIMEATNLTLVKWPNGEWTRLIDHKPMRAGQLGYGWDWLTPHGARTGLELSWGGNEGGPMFFATMFVVWGPARR